MEAYTKILDKFLQILENGRLTDNKCETVYINFIFDNKYGFLEFVVSMADLNKGGLDI
jgi:hypothetical protein